MRLLQGRLNHLSRNVQPVELREDMVMGHGFRWTWTVLPEHCVAGNQLKLLPAAYNPSALCFEFSDFARQAAQSWWLVPSPLALGLPFEAYLEALASELNATPLFNAWFIASVQRTVTGAMELTIEARDGAFDAMWLATPTPTAVHTPARAPSATPRAVYRVFVAPTQNGLQAAPYRLEHTGVVDLYDGIGRLDVASLLDMLFGRDAVPSLGIVSLPPPLRWFVQARTTGDWENTHQAHTYQGGIPPALYAAHGFFERQWQAARALPALVLPPSLRLYVTRTQPVHLDVWNETDAPVLVQAVVFCQTTRQGNAQQPYDVGELPPRTAWAVPMDYQTLWLRGMLLPDTIQYSYDLLKNGLYWRRVTVVCDDATPQDRFIQFFNAYGCPVTLRWTGFVAHDTEVTAVEWQVGGEVPMRHAAVQATTYKRLYRTGYLNEWEQEQLTELLQARRCFEVDAEGYVPLLVAENSKRLLDTQNGLQAFEVTLQGALDYRVASKFDGQMAGKSARYGEKVPYPT
jgi:hypothetical protein